MSELARRILRLQRLGDNAEQELVDAVDAELDPVRDWIFWLRDEFGPDKFCRTDGSPVYREGAEKLAPIVDLIQRSPDETVETVDRFITTNARERD